MNGKFIFGGNGIPPFLMPFMQQEDPRRNPADDAFVPPRINKAMEFLELLAMKRRKMAAATDHQVEVIDQDELNPEEELTQTAALQCLANYFDGKLENNTWEELRLQSIKDKMEQEKKKSKGPLIQMTRVCTCPACGGNDDSCGMCDGCGQLVFEPASGMPEGLSFPVGKPGEGGGIPPELANHPLAALFGHIMSQVDQARKDMDDEDDNEDKK